MKENMGKPKRSRRRGRQESSVLESLGIELIAEYSGVPAATAAVLVSSCLASAGGPEARMLTGWTDERMRPLHLILPGGCRATLRLADQVVDPMRQMNRRLAENFSRYRPDIIDGVALASGIPSKAIGAGDPDTLRRVMLNHAAAMQSPDGEELLLSDLKADPAVLRREAVIHPRIFVGEAAVDDLEMHLDRCHLRSALVYLPRWDRERERESLVRLTELASPASGAPDGGPRGSYLSLNPHLMISLDGRDDGLSGAAMLSHRFLWIEPSERKPERGKPADGLALFRDARMKTLESLLEIRRRGEAPLFEFRDPKSGTVFESHFEDYEEEIAGLTGDPGTSVRDLPRTLVWGLGFLNWNTSARSVGESHLIDEVFRLSRVLLRDHLRLKDAATQRQVRSDGMRLAELVVDKLSAVGPLGMRELVRKFNNQRMEPYRRIMKALIAAEVVAETEDGKLALGTVDLTDAGDDLSFGD